ncbi:MAG: alpha/beta fold hydrolase [Anaerolineae bacterium]|jgi:pimeloyl-ACP methyl ester carboxylesterase|nr:alpha/beta hydrolase [Chloroflexota bacterium]
MPPVTFDQRFAAVPAAQRDALQRFWREHPYTDHLPDGTPWRYIAMGQGRHLVLLLPHALFPADAWFQLALALEGRYRVLLLDGYAWQRVFDPLRLTELIVQTIEAEKRHSATIVAHSCGGSPAQWLLHRWPHRVQGMVLVQAPALTESSAVPYGGSRLRLNTLPWTLSPAALARALAPNLPATGEWAEFARAYIGLYSAEVEKALVPKMLGAERLMRALYRPETQDLRSWRGRALAITAEDDPFEGDSLEIYRQRYADLEVTRFDAGGHWTPLLYPDLLAERVARFLLALGLTR